MNNNVEELGRTARLRDSDVLATLIQGLCVLANCSQKDESSAAGDVLRIAKTAGFMLGGFTPPATWSEEWAEEYRATGYVKVGDQVRIDKYPVLRNGEVLRKGVVCADRFRDPAVPAKQGSRITDVRAALLAPGYATEET